MRKKLDTRFPAARIKKIMQADEDVGKIALAVPVLVSKSLELFLQDLCDRTYEITLERGAKTVSSLHLKHCVERYNVFDFLREVVSKVPDYGQAQGQGHGTGDVAMDDRTISKRRKPISDEVNDSDEENKKSKTVSSSSSYLTSFSVYSCIVLTSIEHCCWHCVCYYSKRWGMLSRVAGVVEGEDEEEAAVDELPKQPKERIGTARWISRPPWRNSHLLKTVPRCMCQCHHPKRTRRRMPMAALQHQTKTPSNNSKVPKKASTLISTLNLST
ncbi:hypothetical protein BRARA_A03338 [Brassica rapa]|uniref:Transcription factor CBF/NF-Y/archaeal histone domain-containing protein n=1 Tax=Brassica campestris TaxID=3711 RepID=A0A398ASK9_BRACM|nr:hypothetical protein BRARA_A03338 [Brassica rapa]